jgi:type IV pilus assembly protein PilV
MLMQHGVSRDGVSRYGASRSSQGFTLIEVMVALIVLSVGLLGIVKLESAAISSTTVAAKRSLAALEGDSLAAMMHVNRGYWTSPDVSGGKITVTGTTVTVATNAPLLATSVAGTTACYGATTPPAACAVTDMAAYDLKDWAAAVNALLPNYTATISCGTGNPVSCTINMTWSENAVAVSGTTTALATPSYSLYVEP